MEALDRWLAWVRRLPPAGPLKRGLARECSQSARHVRWSSASRSTSKTSLNFNQPAPPLRGRFFLGCAIRPRSEGVKFAQMHTEFRGGVYAEAIPYFCSTCSHLDVFSSQRVRPESAANSTGHSRSGQTDEQIARSTFRA